MSKNKIAVLACSVDLENPASAVMWIQQAAKHIPQGGPHYLAVANKYQTPAGIKTFNLQINYPAELAQLVTHANWSKAGTARSPQYRDALALFCLSRFSQAHPTIDQIMLIRGEPFQEDASAPSLQSRDDAPFVFLTHNEDSNTAGKLSPILFNTMLPNSKPALEIALDVAMTGAIYGFDPYSFETLLAQCTNAAASVRHSLSISDAG